jgi:hypothetical protein
MPLSPLFAASPVTHPAIAVPPGGTDKARASRPRRRSWGAVTQPQRLQIRFQAGANGVPRFYPGVREADFRPQSSQAARLIASTSEAR